MPYVVIQLRNVLRSPALEPFAMGQNCKMSFVKPRCDGSESLSLYSGLLLFIKALESRFRRFRRGRGPWPCLGFGFGETSKSECRSAIDVSA